MLPPGACPTHPLLGMFSRKRYSHRLVTIAGTRIGREQLLATALRAIDRQVILGDEQRRCLRGSGRRACCCARSATRTVGGPRSRRTRPTASVTALTSVTSAAWRSLRELAVESPVASAAVPSRSNTATCRPSSASRRAVAAPMPRAAPVTIATAGWAVDAAPPAIGGSTAAGLMTAPPPAARARRRRSDAGSRWCPRRAATTGRRARCAESLICRPLGRRRS